MAHTNDIGMAVGGAMGFMDLHGGEMPLARWDEGDEWGKHTGDSVTTQSLDFTDPSNLILTLDSGERFRITITREG
jgi:hypothetical protein